MQAFPLKLFSRWTYIEYVTTFANYPWQPTQWNIDLLHKGADKKKGESSSVLDYRKQQQQQEQRRRAEEKKSEEESRRTGGGGSCRGNKSIGGQFWRRYGTFKKKNSVGVLLCFYSWFMLWKLAL